MTTTQTIARCPYCKTRLHEGSHLTLALAIRCKARFRR